MVSSGVRGGRGSTVVLEAERGAQQYAQQSRYVGGRTFYQNGSQWIDGEAQKQTDAKHIRIQFESKEYFDLLQKNPKALTWLSLGKNVQFVLDNQIYEVYE